MKTANKPSLILLTPPPPEPPAELVQKALDLAFSNELYDFAGSLSDARSLWRKFPELVEAPEFHPVLRAVFVDQTGHEPNDECDPSYSYDLLQPGFRETLLPKAIRAARVWAAKAREEDAGAKLLGELGITG
jgi:hypothetical protein